MNIRSLLQTAFAQLDAAHVDAPKTTARVLLAQALGRPKEWLVAHDDAVPDATALATFQTLLQRVAAHEPMAYVLGHREFYGLDLVVDKRVLIPRPETEMLVELVLEEGKRLKAEGKKAEGDSPDFDLLPFGFFAIDIGTGSGAVPIAVAKHAPHARLIAADVSTEALDVARMNATKHDMLDQITFVHSNLLADVPMESLREVQVLTANLPYVTTEEITGLQPEIQDHEPRVALDGGADGLDLIRQLLSQIATLVQTQHMPLRAAFFEFGASQGPAVLAAAQLALPFARCEILQDLAKLDRVLSVRFDTGFVE